MSYSYTHPPPLPPAPLQTHTHPTVSSPAHTVALPSPPPLLLHVNGDSDNGSVIFQETVMASAKVSGRGTVLISYPVSGMVSGIDNRRMMLRRPNGSGVVRPGTSFALPPLLPRLVLMFAIASRNVLVPNVPAKRTSQTSGKKGHGGLTNVLFRLRKPSVSSNTLLLVNRGRMTSHTRSFVSKSSMNSSMVVNSYPAIRTIKYGGG